MATGIVYQTALALKGFETHNDDESGTCWPKSPKQPCPPGSHRVGDHCEPNCPQGWHFIHFPFKCVKDPTCQKGFHYVNGKCVRTMVVHKTVVKHITSNNDQTSMVTRNTKITSSPNEVDCDSNIDPQVSNEDYCSGYCIVAISFYPLSTSSYQGKREIVSLQLADQIHKS